MKPIDAFPLIPREVLFGNPERTMARLSPDGAQLGFLAPVDGVLNVWVGPASDPETARPVTQDNNRGVRIFFWAYTNRHILYLQDKGGDENWRVYRVDLGSGESRDLTPFEGVHAQVQEISYKFPEEILVALNQRNPQLHDIYRVNIASGELALIQENDRFANFMTDDDYQVRFAFLILPDGGMDVQKSAGGGEWISFLRIGMEDVMTTSPVALDKTGRKVYLTDSRGRNTSALVEIDLETGEKTVLAEDSRVDVDQVMIHPVEKRVEAVAFNYERTHWQVLDPAVAADLEYLKSVADGELQVVSRTLSDQDWVAAYVVDNGPIQYYAYNRRTRAARFLFSNNRALEGLPLVKMSPLVIKARDGLDLVSYLSLPPGEVMGARQLPMVLVVHGGPWGRDAWGYQPDHQWLANRGYAVLSVNFRASTGLGKDFTNAGNKEWGGKMHDDLIDAVNWVIEKGIADPARVAIMGGSYGGYATLVGLTFTPETFACGVDIVGPSNLVTLLSTIPPYWQPQVEIFATRVGDQRTEEGQKLLTARSPLTHAGRICRPLLIGQGANDPRVKQAEADQIVGAMQDKKIPVTYVLFPDEGHGFARPANRLAFNAIAEAFLSEVLGGRYEPIGEAFNGSSITVPVGSEGVPGLAEVLAKESRVNEGLSNEK